MERSISDEGNFGQEREVCVLSTRPSETVFADMLVREMSHVASQR